MDLRDPVEDFGFEVGRRDSAALSALAAQMFDAVARVQAGSKAPRAVSIHLDFTAREAKGALKGCVHVTKSTASVIFMSAELTEAGASVLRATALYGFSEA